MAAVFIDFKKAFDTVGHEILLSKFKYYGSNGKEFSILNLLQLFTSFASLYSHWTKFISLLLRERE